MTLQEILDSVLLESGMGTETAYVASNDDTVIRLVNLANRSARRIATGHDWQALLQTYSFSLTDETSYDLPTDIRAFIADTTFVDSYLFGVDMRTRPQLWHYLQVNTTGTGPRYRMRVMDNKIEVYQPQSGDTISFEYLTDHPVMATDGTTSKKKFTLDSDTWRLDDDLLIMDLIWRYKKLIGLPDWQLDIAESKAYARTVMGQEAAAKTIIGSDGSEYPVGVPHTQLWINT